MKKIKVKYRKLGQQQAWGIADDSRRTIAIDSRAKGLRKLRLHVHELMHIQNLGWSENKVKKHSSQMARFLWDHGYRFVELNAKKT